MKKEAMNKIQKAVAKFYFALGEESARKPMNAESIASGAECLAYLAIRNTGESIGARYFAMGVASALRKADKPPRGKSTGKPRCGKLSPPKGGKTVAPGAKPVKQAKSVKVLSKGKRQAALLFKAKERMMAEDGLDFSDNCFESGWEE